MPVTDEYNPKKNKFLFLASLSMPSRPSQANTLHKVHFPIGHPSGNCSRLNTLNIKVI
jgi:hypothetical protein